MLQELGRLLIGGACAAACLRVTATAGAAARSGDPVASALQGAMIWDSTDAPGPTSVAFRKTFAIAVKPDAALLHIFADARYMLWINGRYVARGPNRFDPKRPEYDSLDVTEFIQAGDNVIAVLVQSRLSNYRFINHTPGLGIYLQFRTHRPHRPLVTDDSWRCCPWTRFGPPAVLLSGIADDVDETREQSDWLAPDYDDYVWRRARPVSGSNWGDLRRRMIPLLRETVVESAHVVSVSQRGADGAPAVVTDQTWPIEMSAPAVVLVDAGTMVRAGFEVDFEPHGAALFELRPRQSHTDRDAAYLGKCRYRAAPRSGRRTYRTTDDFTCRMVQLELHEGAITLHGLRVIERRFPFERVGWFRSSDPFLNEFWEMAVRTSEVNAVDAYIDGSEGGEWVTGHVDYPVTEAVFAGPDSNGALVYSDPRLLANQLSRLSLSQEGDDLPRAWHPTDWNRGPRDMERGIHNFIEDSACAWVHLLRVVYDATADKKLVDRLWPVLEKIVRWFLERRTPRGLVHAREFYLHFDNPIAYHECEGATLNAWVYRALDDAAYLASKTGREKQGAHCRAAARALAEAYNEHLWDASSGAYLAGLKDGEKKLLTRWPDPSFDRYFASIDQRSGTFPATPQAAAMALWAGLTPPDRLASVQRYLLQHHAEFLSPVSYLFAFEAMYAMDTDAADREVLDTIRRRWAVMVGRKMPGTLGEQFGDESYYCHDFGPVPAAFLAGRVLGVRRDGPLSARRIAIEPRLGDLKEAEGVVSTRHGPVRVSWKRSDSGALSFVVGVPEGASARLSVPFVGPKPVLSIDGRTVRDVTTRGRFVTTVLRAGQHYGEIR